MRYSYTAGRAMMQCMLIAVACVPTVQSQSVSLSSFMVMAVVIAVYFCCVIFMLLLLLLLLVTSLCSVCVCTYFCCCCCFIGVLTARTGSNVLLAHSLTHCTHSLTYTHSLLYCTVDQTVHLFDIIHPSHLKLIQTHF